MKTKRSDCLRSRWRPLGTLLQEESLRLLRHSCCLCYNQRKALNFLSPIHQLIDVTASSRKATYASQFEAQVNSRGHVYLDVHTRSRFSALHKLLIENWNMTVLDYLQRRKCKIFSLKCLRLGTATPRCFAVLIMEPGMKQSITSVHRNDESGLHSVSLDYTADTVMFCI